MKFLAKTRKRHILCILLVVALITASLSTSGLTVIARGEERTFDIGVNPESVTATLSGDGVLTVKGSGAIRDFTPDTAPFADCKIKTVKLGADLTAIGNYTFYNCGGLTGALVLPKGLLRIGDGAFSGSSQALAPKPDSVENRFTESLTTKRKPTESTEQTVSRPEPAESTPAEDTPAEDVPVESTPAEDPSAEDGSGNSDPEGNESAEDNSVEAASAEGEPAESSTPAEQEQSETATETKYVIEKIFQQEIGERIFFPRADGPAFFCSAENETFRSAMVAAGYREAGYILSVTLHCGEGSGSEGDAMTRELPVLDGKITLPEAPSEFSAPSGDGLYRFVFGGWTESKDAAGTLRAAGSVFSVGDRTDLYFIANWKRELTAKIAVKEEDGAKVFTIPALEGYDTLTYRWQTCVLAAGEELPQDEEKLPWEDISGETAQSYRWEIVPMDTGRLFRCVVTVQKQQDFLQALFGGAEEQEVSFAAVEAIPGEKADAAVSQGTAIIRGRSFSGSISGAHPTIGTQGAVTASFVSQYQPTGKDDTHLLLCKKEGETFVKAPFPAGTKLVLGDMTGGGCKYYSYTVPGGSAELSLSGFTAVSGAGKYAPPAAGTGDTNITEKLLIVTDFSAAGLPQGEYGLAVLHGTEQLETAQKAAFAVTAMGGCSLELTQRETDSLTWNVTVLPTVSGIDSRYAAGACIRLWLTASDGQNVGFPGEMLVSRDTAGAAVENILLEQDGSLTFTTATGSASTVILQFSSLGEDILSDGEYQLHASLSPRAGLQMSSRQGQIDASAAVGVSLYRSDTGAESSRRSLSIDLSEDSQRLLDVSEEGSEMEFLLSYQGIQEGDTIQAEVLYKIGTDPDDSSYSPAPGDWDISLGNTSLASGTPSGDSETLRLTVPQGQEHGTYRLRVRILDSAGSVVAEQPYNFIVE